ncbi:ATP-binding protein [Streptomyces sp. NPDC086082]|uniref:ATP-binding protein n=1 Tax=Streptomyces sp. NPDC086082 TaxID=3365750 RepID=UPI00381607AC
MEYVYLGEGEQVNGEDGSEETAHDDVDGFKPLPPTLRLEVRELALALRRLLKGSGKSQRQFASYYRTSVSSVSRYLSGERIPEKHFIDGLMKSACKAHGTEVSADLQGRIYQLHRDALLADNPARYREQMASDRLEEAVLREEELELESRELYRAVEGHRRQLRALESQLREVRAAQEHQQHAPKAEIERRQTRKEELEEECARLREEVARLEHSLRQAQRDRDAASLRCQELEAELAAANQDAERADLERQAREERLRLAKAADVAEHRLADLERVHAEAERVRGEAGVEAAKKLEEARVKADELLKDAELRATRVRPTLLKRSAALRQLKEAAQLMTERQLPELTQQLALPLTTDIPVDHYLQAIGLQGDDDVAQAARALEVAQRACVELAVGHALLRQRSVSMMATFARRCQALLHRQLNRISELESAEDDPQRLDALFELDHLARLARRTCDNLLTLADPQTNDPGKPPERLVDVLAAAASEVEDHQRIMLISVPAASLHGVVVNDLVHLLAELLENALTFSPPHTTVKVTGHALPDGRMLIEIEDQGLGMTEQTFFEVNQRLASPPSLDDHGGNRFGLDLACRLGARHAIRMQLRPSGCGGVTALVMLPVGVCGEPASTPAHYQHLALTAEGLFGTKPLVEELTELPYVPAPVKHLFTICDSGGLFIEHEV